MKKNIYIAQFGTGSNINLLPLAAGQLYSSVRCKQELYNNFNLCEIIFKRENPEELALRLEHVAVIGFSCFLWNLNITRQAASAIRARFPQALIVAGGPAIPKTGTSPLDFLTSNPAFDMICTGEGEEVFVQICTALLRHESFDHIPGIIYKERATGCVRVTAPEVNPCLEHLMSPFLDGTFDVFYDLHYSEFSGICWETNRGCPYECTYCTWGNLPSHQMRLKPMEQVRGEIEWIGRHKIRYIAMADSNFGIMPRDIEISRMLADCRKRHGFPLFIGVSWAKHASSRVIEIGRILKAAGIGFRVTLSLQSLNGDVVKAVKRSNYDNDEFRQIKNEYRHNGFYSYTELILGLPLETYRSYLQGIELSLSPSVFEQLYVYPLFLFPNTGMATKESRDQYEFQTKVIPNRYTKSREIVTVQEYVEIVVSTSTMPKQQWINAFVTGYYALTLHDDRLAFFILRFLNKMFGIVITELIEYARSVSNSTEYPTVMRSFRRLAQCALSVQEKGESHLIEPVPYGGIPFDPPDGIFLELLLERTPFYAEFFSIMCGYLEEREISFNRLVLADLFLFQKAVIAHPDGPFCEEIELKYNWVDYFKYTFGASEIPLQLLGRKFRIIDVRPSHGNHVDFLKNHFEVRGVPPFFELHENGTRVFPSQWDV
ncbi:MAG: radical SAM protein [Desulfuromonadales bacterium]